MDNLALASNGNKFNLDLASFRVKSLIYFDLVPRGPNGQLMPNTSYNQLRWLARTTTGRRVQLRGEKYNSHSKTIQYSSLSMCIAVGYA